MKKFVDQYTDAQIFIGLTEEIKALYKSMCHAWEKGVSDYIPLFVNRAKFSPKKQSYALYIDDKGYFTVGSSDAALADISLDYWILEE